MSTFEAPVVTIDALEPIDGADRIELARIADYRSVVKKGAFQVGEPVVYIPEAALVPEWLLREIGLWDDAKGKGRLAGSRGNRVKAIKLRGCLSQGLIYPADPAIHDADDFAPAGSRLATVSVFDDSVDDKGHPLYTDHRRHVTLEIGADAAGALGLEKWEPEIPAELLGEVCALAGKTLRYDLENLKRYPDAFGEGEPVQITEKLHGVLLQIGHWPGLAHPELPGGELIVTSKGLGAKGLAFVDAPANADNLYLKTARALAATLDLPGRLTDLRQAGRFGLGVDTPVYLVGELFGQGVQDLGYGAGTPEVRGFDVFIGRPQQGRFLDPAAKAEFLAAVGIAQVPVLYEGPWCRATADALRDGETTLGAGHIREGVVITPMRERRDDRFGRVALKHVSDAYLTRTGGTEYS